MSKNILGNAEVYDKDQVYQNAIVSGNAKVYDRAEIYGNARVSDFAQIFGNARVFGNAKILDSAKISGNAEISGDAKVFGNAHVSGYAHVLGSAVIGSDRDWFSFEYHNKTLTGYLSQNKDGYELNIDGKIISIREIHETDAIIKIKKFINKMLHFNPRF